MSATLNLGTDGNWATKKDTILAYNDENSNFKPLPFSFERDTLATRVNKDGLIETVGSGEPRIDYKDDSKGALKLEPSRTNSITYSNDFSKSIYGKINLTITANQGISPDGTQNANLLVPNAAVGNRYLTNSTGSNLKINTVFLKKKELRYVKVGNAQSNVLVDLENGTISADSVSTNNFTIENYGNGWYRVSCYNTLDVNLQIQIFFGIDGSGSSIATNGNDGVYIYGFEIQNGSYPTSHIPTQGGVVTRVAESCLGQIIGYDTSSSFSLFFSFGKTRKSTQSSTHIFSTNTTSGKDIYLYTNSSGNDGLNIYITNGGGYLFGANQNNGWNAEQSKICITYDISTSRFAYFINGSLYGHQTNVLNLGQTDYTSIVSNNNIFETREHKFYNNALTDTEAIALTTI